MRDDFWIGGLLVLIVVVIVAAVVGSIHEAKEWAAFSANHECKVVEKIKSSSNIGYGMTSNGKMGTVVMTMPEKIAYLCDDGVTYWR